MESQHIEDIRVLETRKADEIRRLKADHFAETHSLRERFLKDMLDLKTKYERVVRALKFTNRELRTEGVASRADLIVALDACSTKDKEILRLEEELQGKCPMYPLYPVLSLCKLMNASSH